MDPALQELLARGQPEDEVAVVIRLREGAPLPENVRVVARFGDVATARVRRASIPKVRASEAVVSVKAPHPLESEPTPDGEPDEREADDLEVRATDRRRPPDLPFRGGGVTLGFVDWGLDFAHPDLRREDGTTRLLALWDQRAEPGADRPSPFGYGRVYTRGDIDRALLSPDPYGALGYHPADADSGAGAHGTHTVTIAGGNGRSGGPVGLAPDAGIVFVHPRNLGGPPERQFGGWVGLLEGLRWITDTVGGDTPLVVNLSLGRQAGPHDASTLPERALDAFVTEAPGRAVVQSTGNYYARRAHASGTLHPGERRELRLLVPEGDPTENELDLWYSGRDRLRVRLDTPGGERGGWVPLGENARLGVAGGEARVYHRAFDPQNGDHQVSVYLPAGVGGEWTLHLETEHVEAGHPESGRFHAWIERDAGCRGCAMRLPDGEADPATTTGSICNGHHTVAVGAYDGHDPGRPLAPFSSAGLTRDGRQKPDLIAPGRGVLAGRSAPREGEGPLLTRMSGTSMAAPQVSGTVALMFEAAGKPLPVDETRALLLGACDPSPHDPTRTGHGCLNVLRAVEAARAWGEGGVGEDAPPAAPPGETAARDADLPEVDWNAVLAPYTTLQGQNSQPADSEPIPEEVSMPHSPCGCHPTPSEHEDSADTLAEAASPWASPLPELADEALLDPQNLTSLVLLTEILRRAGQPVPQTPPASAESLLGHLPLDQIAGPGQVLDVPLWAGDVLLRRREGGQTHAAIIAEPTVYGLSALPGARLTPEWPRAGGYVQVVEGGPFPHRLNDRFARRVTDAAGRVPGDTLVLRPRLREEETDPGTWAETPPERPLLVRGSVGPWVVEAQRRLNLFHARETAAGRPGLPDAPLEEDGRFGPRTQAATVAFQQRVFPGEPREWDGKIGPRTWAQLDGVSGPDVPPIVPPGPPVSPPGVLPVVFSGQGTIPVIIVPGIMGSRLRNASGGLVWNPMAFPGANASGPLTCSGGFGAAAANFDRLSDPTPLRPAEDPDIPARCGALAAQARGVAHFGDLVFEFYSRLAFHLSDPALSARLRSTTGRDLRVFACGYDWRQDNAVSAARLERVIDEALREVGAPGGQVFVVAHSMGGLVSRFYHASRGAASRIAALFLLGSPTHGAPQSYRMLKQGVSAFVRADINLSLLFPLKLQHQLMRMLRGFPSLYQLLPTTAYGAHDPGWLRFDVARGRAGLPPVSDAANVNDLYLNPHTGFLDGQNGSSALDARVATALASRTLFEATVGCTMPARTHVIFSNGVPTEAREELVSRWRPAPLVPFEVSAVGTAPGDGTVPEFSAQASGCAALARHNVGGVRHDALPNDPAVLRLLSSLIEREAGLLTPGQPVEPPVVAVA